MKLSNNIGRYKILLQVVSMIPGFSSQFIEKGKEKEGQAKIKRYMTMMDSMTDAGEPVQHFLLGNHSLDRHCETHLSLTVYLELDGTNPKLMNQSRINRIARGSGRLVEEVVHMLEEYKRIAKMWKKLPLPTNNRRLNTNRDIRPIANAIPPNMLNQLGGLVGLQNMMKQMGAQSR
jgi:signal recognition particle subunit SRP54